METSLQSSIFAQSDITKKARLYPIIKDKIPQKTIKTISNPSQITSNLIQLQKA